MVYGVSVFDLLWFFSRRISLVLFSPHAVKIIHEQIGDHTEIHFIAQKPPGQANSVSRGWEVNFSCGQLSKYRAGGQIRQERADKGKSTSYVVNSAGTEKEGNFRTGKMTV